MTGSAFLNQIGLGGFDLGYLLIGMTVTILLLLIFLILLIVQIRKTSKLKKRLDKFLTGKDGTSLEQDIAGLYEDNKFLNFSPVFSRITSCTGTLWLSSLSNNVNSSFPGLYRGMITSISIAERSLLSQSLVYYTLSPSVTQDFFI